jgi:hypothetical protein
MKTVLEEVMYRHSYAVKRRRFEDGSGQVVVFKYSGDIGVVQREFRTSFRSDVKLYDKLSQCLASSRSDEEFERDLSRLLP